jgi:hypothetical protein
MTDVFMMNYFGENAIRHFMARVCHERWRIEDCNFMFAVPGNPRDFHSTGKKECEQAASTEIYVVADNDCLILGKDWVNRGRALVDRHPEYGLLAAANICEGEFASGTNWQTEDEVVERTMVGGIVFVRKGILTDFPMCEPMEVDRVICDEIRSKGYKTGIMPQLRFNHLGAGYSLSNPDWWMKVPG